MISQRAHRWSGHDQTLVKAHFKCALDPYDPSSNPNGYINFGTAENKLLFEDIKPLLEKSAGLCEDDAHYNELYGSGFFREAIAGFLAQRAGRQILPSNIVVASGASAILELLAFVLCDPDDGILIPAPYYTGFDHDLGLRSDAKLVQLPLESPDFKLTVDLIGRGYEEAKKNGIEIKAVLLTSPHNPLGHIYDGDLVSEVLDFARREGIHLILDEIYAESLLPGATHFSGLQIQNPFVHVVYGFAKDFGLSGYKVGILHSENPDIIKTVKGFAYFHTVSGQTQRTLAGLLTSPGLDEFLMKMRKKLLESYNFVSKGLMKAGIPFVEPQGGILLWLDLRRFFQPESFEDEKKLFEQLFEKCRISISPGWAFHSPEPGWFRLCHTVPSSHLKEGLERLTGYLRTM